MPEITDKATGKVILELPYDSEGKEKAEQIVQSNPNLEINKLAPGGSFNAMQRSQTMYAGGGKTGYNVSQYKKGEKVKK